MQASLIITTYNQAKNLRLILDSVGKQTCTDIEIIIADDGSHDPIVEVVADYRQRLSIPMAMISQEDLGFRKTMILNKAIHRAQSDYLVFIDGDMILHPRFIENHLRYRNPQSVLCGYRGVKLMEAHTEKLMAGETGISASLPNLLLHKLQGNLKNPLRSLQLHHPAWRKIAVSYRNNLSGCNFSLYREAIELVNGFDEDILEHGYEDYELGCRLKRAGYHLVNVSKLCNTYHLYHKPRKGRPGHISQKIGQISQAVNTTCSNGLYKRQPAELMTTIPDALRKPRLIS